MIVLRRSLVAFREGAWGLACFAELEFLAEAPARSPCASVGTPLTSAVVPPFVPPPWRSGTLAESCACRASLPEFWPQLPLQPRTGLGTNWTHEGVISRFARRKWPYLSNPLMPPFVK